MTTTTATRPYTVRFLRVPITPLSFTSRQEWGALPRTLA